MHLYHTKNAGVDPTQTREKTPGLDLTQMLKKVDSIYVFRTFGLFPMKLFLGSGPYHFLKIFGENLFIKKAIEPVARTVIRVLYYIYSKECSAMFLLYTILYIADERRPIMKNFYHDDQNLLDIINLINDPDYEDWSYLDTQDYSDIQDYSDEDEPLPHFGAVSYLVVTGLTNCVRSLAAGESQGTSVTAYDEWPQGETCREMSKPNGTILIFKYEGNILVSCDHYYIDRYGEEQYRDVEMSMA